MERRVRFAAIVLILSALIVTGCSTAQRAVERAVQEAVSEVAQEAASSVTEPTSSKGGKGTDTDPEPTAAPAGQEPADEDEAFDPDTATAFEQLDSYRMTQVLEWEVEDEGGVDEGTMRWEIAYVREPRATQWRMSGQQGPDAEETFMEMISLDGATYMSYGDEWMSMTSEEEIANPWAYSPDDLVTGDSHRVGTETVNGYRCVHYRVDNEDTFLGAGHITQADYWLSNEHDVVVRGIVTWSGSGLEGESGQWSMQWDITEINEPITITAPEGVAKPGLPDDVPLMPGATNTSSMMGMTSFEIDAAADEVTAFYVEALEDNGWTHDDSPIPAMHSFSKDGRELTLMVDDDSSPTSVTIMIAGE